MRYLLASALTLALALALPAQPAIEVRVQPVRRFLEVAEYTAKLVDQEDAGNQATQFVQSMIDPKKGLEGIDPDRPIGLYATVAENPVESQVVAVVPIADEEAFLGLLTGKLSLEPKKGDDGVYSVQAPGVPLPVHFRFADKSCYVTVGLPAALEKDRLIAPKTFFAAPESGLLAVRVRLDRLPPKLVKQAIAQAELKAADDAKNDPDTPEGRGQKLGRELALAAFAAAATEGKEFAVRLTADPKADDLSADLKLTAKDGTGLQKTFRGLTERKAVAGGLAVPSDPLAVLRVNARLTGKAQEQWAEQMTALLAEAVAKAKESDKQAAKLVADAVGPTLKSGVFDLGVAALAGSGKAVRVVGAAAVVDGKRIETVVKQFAPFAPEDKAKFAFDQGTAGGLTLHTVTVADPKFGQATGTDKVWLGTGEKRLAFAVEPDGKLLKATADQAPAPAPVFEARFAIARILPLLEDALPADKAKALTSEVFGATGPAAGTDALALTVAGGEALTARVSLTGKALALLVKTDKAKKAKD